MRLIVLTAATSLIFTTALADPVPIVAGRPVLPVAAVKSDGLSPVNRVRMARRYSHCVITELEKLEGVLPGALTSASAAHISEAKDSCQKVKRAWRLELQKAFFATPRAQRPVGQDVNYWIAEDEANLETMLIHNNFYAFPPR